MPQYSFSSEEQLINSVDEIAKREKRSRSEMIVILLESSIKERERNRLKKSRAKEIHSEDQSPNSR
jgi:metal-responsive CopG/Arc/MetJ family transcriptional regulator